jgi:hypothetical protein
MVPVFVIFSRDRQSRVSKRHLKTYSSNRVFQFPLGQQKLLKRKMEQVTEPIPEHKTESQTEYILEREGVPRRQYGLDVYVRRILYVEVAPTDGIESFSGDLGKDMALRIIRKPFSPFYVRKINASD